jgi:hypothetical protein
MWKWGVEKREKNDRAGHITDSRTRSEVQALPSFSLSSGFGFGEEFGEEEPGD